MWGTGAINQDTTMTGYEQQTPERAVKNIKDVLSAYKYHQFNEVNNILVAQVGRVATMLNQIEQYLASITVTTRAGTFATYQPMGLGAQWRTFMNGRAAMARSKAETYMDDWVQSLQNGYATPYLRDHADAAGLALIDKIDHLATAVAGRTAWVVPNF